MVWFFGAVALILLIVFPRQSVVLVLAAVGLALIVGGGAYVYDNYEKSQRAKLAIEIRYDPESCGDAYPLVTKISNDSKRTVLNTSWGLSIKQPGRSSELVDYSYRDRSTDVIIKPGYEWSGCYPLPKISSFLDPKTLIYSVRWKNVRFE
ncbi:MAG: hypothetical protein CMI02_07490 [Oceanospirillaceae bacterium]|nr:hypothetical protein [Oceanospirillaceae bacterium]